MNIFQWLGAGGGVTAIAALVYLWPTIQKMRAEAGKARTDAAIAVDAADDAHWQAIVTTQTEQLIKPLREELARQGAEIKELRDQIDRVTHRYRSALGYIRQLIAQIRRDHGMPTEAPADIAADI